MKYTRVCGLLFYAIEIEKIDRDRREWHRNPANIFKLMNVIDCASNDFLWKFILFFKFSGIFKHMLS